MLLSCQSSCNVVMRRGYAARSMSKRSDQRQSSFKEIKPLVSLPGSPSREQDETPVGDGWPHRGAVHRSLAGHAHLRCLWILWLHRVRRRRAGQHHTQPLQHAVSVFCHHARLQAQLRSFQAELLGEVHAAVRRLLGLPHPAVSSGGDALAPGKAATSTATDEASLHHLVRVPLPVLDRLPRL